MAYTVKDLAKLSGVSIRTLHYYDEIDLLKPAYHATNGYRHYEEEQLLLLQQILFFRELGFELKQIQKILGRGDFDKIVALSSHREVLIKNLERTRKLIKTVDKTIEHLRGTKKMKEQELYHGFSKEQQAAAEKRLIELFGEQAKKAITESHNSTNGWNKADWDKSRAEGEAICKDLAKLKEKGLKADSKEAQAAIKRHFQWIKQFWTPNKQSYTAHGQVMVRGDLKAYYDTYGTDLSTFVADAIAIFAEHQLE
ncbi:MAG: MerR family transcriptional regulator [Chlamydiales bacterium]|nr:MerR family transcriptional regulator [Chlamydiales bacterium]